MPAEFEKLKAKDMCKSYTKAIGRIKIIKQKQDRPVERTKTLCLKNKTEINPYK